MDVGRESADRLRPKGLTDGLQESRCSDSELQALRDKRYKLTVAQPCPANQVVLTRKGERGARSPCRVKHVDRDPLCRVGFHTLACCRRSENVAGCKHALRSQAQATKTALPGPEGTIKELPTRMAADPFVYIEKGSSFFHHADRSEGVGGCGRGRQQEEMAVDDRLGDVDQFVAVVLGVVA